MKKTTTSNLPSKKLERVEWKAIQMKHRRCYVLHERFNYLHGILNLSSTVHSSPFSPTKLKHVTPQGEA